MSAHDLGTPWVAVSLSEFYEPSPGGQFCGGPQTPTYRDVLAVLNDNQHGLQVGETISRPAWGAEEAMRGVRRDVGRCDTDEQYGIKSAPDFPSFGDDSFTFREVFTLSDGKPVFETLTFVRRGDLILTVSFTSHILYAHDSDVVTIADAKFLKLVAGPH